MCIEKNNIGVCSVHLFFVRCSSLRNSRRCLRIWFRSVCSANAVVAVAIKKLNAWACHRQSALKHDKIVSLKTTLKSSRDCICVANYSFANLCDVFARLCTPFHHWFVSLVFRVCSRICQKFTAHKSCPLISFISCVNIRDETTAWRTNSKSNAISARTHW